MENLLLDTIGNVIKGNSLTALTNLIGADSENATKKGIVTGASALMSSLAKTASTPVGTAGIQQLMTGIDPKIVDDLETYLKNPFAVNGGEMLQHFLAGDLPVVAKKVGKASGLGADTVSRLLSILAPLVMGTAHKAIQNQGVEAKDLPKFFADQAGFMRTLTPGLMGFLERIDANDDNSILDDLGRLTDRVFGGHK